MYALLCMMFFFNFVFFMFVCHDSSLDSKKKLSRKIQINSLSIMEMNQAFCNYSLNVSEQAAVKASLTEIKLNENFKSTRFWGKIFAAECDYLIIEATSITNQINHKYFFRYTPFISYARIIPDSPSIIAWMED